MQGLKVCAHIFRAAQDTHTHTPTSSSDDGSPGKGALGGAADTAVFFLAADTFVCKPSTSPLHTQKVVGLA